MKYEKHAGQSQKKRLLAMAQSECLLSGPNTSQSASQLKQEPTEFSASSNSLNYSYEHQKRSSWVGSSDSGHPSLNPPTAHHHHSNGGGSSKRESGYSTIPNQPNGLHHHQLQQQQPPVAHAKQHASSSSSNNSWNGTPIYHHHRQQPQNTTPLGNSPVGGMSGLALLQPQQAPDMYAQTELYRRPTVFVQAPYNNNFRVVPTIPPPAHNNSRQVMQQFLI